MALAEAEARARAAGRGDIAEYLALRKSNDLIRRTACSWLLDLFAAAAGGANRQGAAIQISTDIEHRFKLGNASLVGSSIKLKRGVRTLLVEVGWPRAPRDGFIRGGGLAFGRIKHLGIKPANEELRLVLDDNGTPCWTIERKLTVASSPYNLHETNVRNHLQILLSDSRR
jgi:hypothetical protein